MEEPKKRNPFIAALLVFCGPGFGQIYNSEGQKALTLFFAILGAYAASTSRFVIWFPWLFFALNFFALALTFYALVDAVLNSRELRAPKWYTRWYVYLIAFFNYLIFISLIVLSRNAQPFKIPTSSMAPTLVDGDRILVDMKAYSNNTPKPGDIVVFNFPRDPAIRYIKRVIGIGGDSIEFRNKILSVNGKPVQAFPLRSESAESGKAQGWFDSEDNATTSVFVEQWGNGHLVAYNSASTLSSEFGPTTVFNGSLFVLGDNRDKSSDSRIWGGVPEDNVIGRPVYVWFSRDPQTHRIRWERIGLVLH